MSSAGFLPLLITGIAGVAGYNAFQFFSRKYPGQVVGTRRTDNWPLSGDGIIPLDADDRRGWLTLCEQHRFAAVINAEGSCKLKSCELDPRMAWRVNVEGLANLLTAVGGRPVRLIHLSIDLVFSGAGGGGYVEQDATDPVTVYGKTMVAAEHLIATERPDACVLRISLPMGVSFNGHAGAIDWIQSRFQQHKPATLYFDEVRSPTYTDCLNRLLERLLVSDLSGVYHAGGPRRLSLYEIAQIVNRIGGYAPELLIGCPRREAGPIPPRAGNVCLDSTKLAQDIGFEPFAPWPLEDTLMPTHRGWHHERLGDQSGSPEWLSRVLYRNPVYAEVESVDG